MKAGQLEFGGYLELPDNRLNSEARVRCHTDRHPRRRNNGWNSGAGNSVPNGITESLSPETRAQLNREASARQSGEQRASQQRQYERSGAGRTVAARWWGWSEAAVAAWRRGEGAF
jgi:hypothetical protein